MLDRLVFYLYLVVSQCLPSTAGASPGLADYVFAATAVALGITALWMLGHGLRGRDDARSGRIKTAVLED